MSESLSLPSFSRVLYKEIIKETLKASIRDGMEPIQPTRNDEVVVTAGDIEDIKASFDATASKTIKSHIKRILRILNSKINILGFYRK